MCEEHEKQIEDLQSKLELSAKFGQQLLAANEQLNIELENVHKEHGQILEANEQEKYDLNMKISRLLKSEESYKEEVTDLQLNIKKLISNQSDVIEVQHQAQIGDLKKQITGLENDLAKVHLTEKQLSNKCQQLESQKSSLQEELKSVAFQANDTLCADMEKVMNDYQDAITEKDEALENLNEVKQELERTALNVKHLQREVEDKDREIEEKECQATSYFNALERARGEVRDLKTELDLVQLESQDQKEKGNSLFSEVEDRRIQAEKELISVKIYAKKVEKRNEITTQQLQKLKNQIAPLLQASRGQVSDRNYIESLQADLAQARRDIENLHKKVSDFKGSASSGSTTQAAPTMGTDATDIYNHLDSCIEQRDEEIKKLKGELQTKELNYLAEAQINTAHRRQIYELEQNETKLRAKIVNLNLKIDEMKIRYEPEKLNHTQRALIKEVIPVSKENDNHNSITKEVDSVFQEPSMTNDLKKGPESVDDEKIRRKKRRETLAQLRTFQKAPKYVRFSTDEDDCSKETLVENESTKSVPETNVQKARPKGRKKIICHEEPKKEPPAECKTQ